MAIDEKADRPLPELIEAGDSAEGLYAELRAAFDEERAKLTSTDELKTFRDRWMGRKNGLLAAVNDAWLKSAPRELKPVVGKLQNQTKKAFEAALAEALHDAVALGQHVAGIQPPTWGFLGVYDLGSHGQIWKSDWDVGRSSSVIPSWIRAAR